MNKIYFGIPILALAGFIGWFVFWNSDYESGKRQIEEAAKLEQMLKLQQDQAAQAEAIRRQNEEIRRLNEERTREREAEALAKESRERNLALRDELQAELRAISQRIISIRRDVELEESLIAKTEKEKNSLQAEKDFLSDYVKLAQGNTSRMLSVVERVIKAAEETAKIKAEIEAAKAAGGKKS